jgi:hypothetical protein
MAYTLYNPSPTPTPLPEPRGQAQPIGGIGDLLTNPWVVIALAGAAVWFLSREEKKPPKRRTRKQREKGDPAPGWYAIGYNYPRDHKPAVDRRMKMVQGPFKNKEQAQRVKRREDPPWYVDVRYRKTYPW